jgi:hypothetical protein
MMPFFSMFILEDLSKSPILWSSRRDHDGPPVLVTYKASGVPPLSEMTSCHEPEGCAPLHKFSFSSRSGHVSTGITLILDRCLKRLLVVAA